MKCLEKDRARRYDTANGVAMDIQRHLSNEPVLARPPSRMYEFQKTVRRHKFGFAAAAGLIAVLAIGVLLSTWQAVRAVKAERLANEQRLRAEQEAERADSNAKAEKQQREMAEAEAQKARDILAFLQKMFTSTGNAYADKVTVVQMLDWGSAGVKEQVQAAAGGFRRRAILDWFLLQQNRALGHGGRFP